MKWTLKIMVPAGINPNDGLPAYDVTFETRTAQTQIRSRMAASKAGHPLTGHPLPGTLIKLYEGFNDEPDAARNGSVVLEYWSLVGVLWSLVT